jgi:hypothetical protein
MRARLFRPPASLSPLSAPFMLFLIALCVLWALLPRAGLAKPTSNAGQCRPQKAQEFLKRPYFVRRGQLDARRNDRSVRFRVERYGHIEGLAFESLNPVKAHSQIVGAQFFGLGIQVHRAIAPALRCVEKRIRKNCTKRDERYSPRALGGFRQNNTYRGGEISNHLFGIAVDIDPDRNPCCGCVEPWPEHPACQGDAESVFERTELPRCWIYAFERYGFYWLGRDPILRDTMHFEFLGDPDRVLTKN